MVWPGFAVASMVSLILPCDCQLEPYNSSEKRIMQVTPFGGALLTITVLVAGAVSLPAATRPSAKHDMAGIARLH